MEVKTSRKTLKQLFWPIFFELLFMTLVGSVDTLMASSIGEFASGAVNASNTFIALFIISFSIISSGVMAVMTQFIGAKKESVAVKALKLGLYINTLLGIVLSLVLFFFAKDLLILQKVPSNQFDDALNYTKIIGGTLFLSSITPILSSYLRAFGKTSLPMISSFTSNILNVIFNAIWIFGLLGAPKLGVIGVAYATIISKAFNLLLNIVFALFFVKPKKDNFEITNKEVLQKIIKIGLPAALETTLYNFAMMLISTMINDMQPEGVNNTAYSYTTTISRFSYITGSALAQANAIMVGWAIGENRQDEAYHFTLKRLNYGIVISVIVALSMALLAPIFLKEIGISDRIVSICQKILFIDIALEIGRISNITIGMALKTSGDALYTVIIAIIFMFLFGVGLSFLLGVQLELLLIGCYIGLALDEITRGILMFFRWKSKKWTKKSLLKN